MAENQKSQTTRVRLDSPDENKIIARSSLTGRNYTCAICSAVCTGLEQFKAHLAEVHNARNKEPQHQ
jgi:hypothetical protein